jgi:GH25 family lysozyme M1 (1,4-beta-N-acetylmuramidase)
MNKIPGTLIVAALLGSVACGTDLAVDDFGDVAKAGAFDAPGEEQGLTRQCQPAQTLKGIDVSYWQDGIDWSAVAGDGVRYAFIRVSDGNTFIDPRFQENWRGARQAGVLRGAYQFFRSNRDPIEQANILLDQMGPLQAGDLPPVIDVESTDGQSSATVARKVKAWVDHVKARLGVTPIVYTGPYFWRDSVKSDAHVDSPLWIAHYGTDCPLTPEPWSNWTFHQYSDSGRVRGIRGNVDMNAFRGTLADLQALAVSDGGQPPAPPPTTTDCESIPAAGRVIDDDDACFFAGGATQYLRAESGEGYNGGLIWTAATAASSRENYGEWTLRFAEPGRYRLQAFTDTSVATSQFTRYRIEHDGAVERVQVDQHSVDGFRDLGTFTFSGGSATVTLDDNTGEPVGDRKRIVFDALQVLPAGAPGSEPTPEPEPGCTRVRVVNATALNVRPTPATTQGAVGTLAGNDVVIRTDTVDDGQSVRGNRTWHHIERGNLSGWVSSVYAVCVD